jgi:hypothetical protein
MLPLPRRRLATRRPGAMRAVRLAWCDETIMDRQARARLPAGAAPISITSTATVVAL